MSVKLHDLRVKESLSLTTSSSLYGTANLLQFLNNSNQIKSNIVADNNGNVKLFAGNSLYFRFIYDNDSSASADGGQGLIFQRTQLYPQVDGGYDLGTTACKFGNIYARLLTITNDVTVGGGLTIAGNLTVNGTQTILNTETVQSKDHLIELAVRDGTSSIVTPGGIVVKKYNGTDDAGILVDSSGKVYAGTITYSGTTPQTTITSTFGEILTKVSNSGTGVVTSISQNGNCATALRTSLEQNANSSGNGIVFLDTISQAANGKISYTTMTVRNASATQSGVVSTGAQTFEGAKTFIKTPILNEKLVFQSDSYPGAIIAKNAAGNKRYELFSNSSTGALADVHLRVYGENDNSSCSTYTFGRDGKLTAYCFSGTHVIAITSLIIPVLSSNPSSPAVGQMWITT